MFHVEHREYRRSGPIGDRTVFHVEHCGRWTELERGSKMKPAKKISMFAFLREGVFHYGGFFLAAWASL